MCPSDLSRRLDRFLAGIDRDAAIDRVVDEVPVDPAEVQRLLDTYLNETSVALDLVAPVLSEPARVLEVGAGIGAFSAFLASVGHDVTAVEPAVEGFELMHAMRRALDEQWPDVHRSFLPIGVEDTSPELGKFDLAFSVHVLEHVPNVTAAIRAIHRLLGSSGRSVHICPNYAFPYEPHFGVPLLPGRPSATAHLLPTRTTDTGLWKSLNFVSARDIRRIARELGLEVHFRSDALGEMVDRLQTDEVFRQRHHAVATGADLLLRRLRLRGLLRRWPARLATPMVFELRRY